MMIRRNTKNNPGLVLVLIFCFLAIAFQGCKKKRSEMAALLYKRTHNEVFKDFDPDVFAASFKKELIRQTPDMNNPQIITDHYDQNNYEPDFVMHHLWDGGLQAMVDKFRKAGDHGTESTTIPS